jgi:scyllo-inositol 2-dehydrogenase (NADP+)
MTPVCVGLIGSGKSGRIFHAPVIGAIPQLLLKTAVERHGDEFRKVFPTVNIVREVDELLQDDGILLVVIATPNASHFDLARQALAAGKHVVIDKPFTVSMDQARTLIDLARAKGVLLSVYQNRRWDGDFLTVKQLIGEGRLGRIIEFESHLDRFRTLPRTGAWKESAGLGSGLFWDLGPHLIDQALQLFGPPERVLADIRIQREGALTDDYFEVKLFYDSFVATLKAGMLVPEPNRRFTLRGTKGSFVKQGVDPQEAALMKGGNPTDQGWGVEPPESWGTFYTCKGDRITEEKIPTVPGCYQAFYENVAWAIAGTAALAVKPEEAFATIRIIEAARQSGKNGQIIQLQK